jgi:hypothetical protein
VAAEVRLEFYRGIKEIANFLGLHPDTVAQKLREGKIAAAKKDGLGRWVLTDLDYYRSLRDVREVRPQA